MPRPTWRSVSIRKPLVDEIRTCISDGLTFARNPSEYVAMQLNDMLVSVRLGHQFTQLYELDFATHLEYLGWSDAKRHSIERKEGLPRGAFKRQRGPAESVKIPRKLYVAIEAAVVSKSDVLDVTRVIETVLRKGLGKLDENSPPRTEAAADQLPHQRPRRRIFSQRAWRFVVMA